MGTGLRRIDPETRAVRTISYQFGDTHLEYSTGQLIYRGVHIIHDSGTDETDWEIWKLTWDGDDLVRIEGPLTGAWDDRATLDWGA